jgi:hypothetical protein
MLNVFRPALWAAQVALAAGLVAAAAPAQAQITVGGTVYQVQGLVGVGRMDAALRDSFGETFGSISGLWADPGNWARSGGTYTGTFLTAPDRGYNVAGTIDYAPRLNEIAVSFTPAALGATGLAQNQIGLTLTRTTQLTENLAGGGPRLLTGLDPVPGGVATGGARPGNLKLPELPQAFNGKLSLDAEGVVVLADGSRLVSDEYGPSIYRFDATGRFIGALPVAASVRPIRNGVTDYSSNNPGAGQPAPSPTNPTFGRANNQGFEGLSLSPDGRTLFVTLQSAARQDGAASGAAFRDHTRLFTYDVSNLGDIRLTGEYVVRLPKFVQGSATLVAAQSEVHAISDTQLLILPRDSNGLGVGTQTSLLRRVDVIDIAAATNILGQPYEGQIAPAGVLNPAITPATYAPWLNINNNAELARFGLVNGVVSGLDNLSEKWEGLALLPALDPDAPNDYFLFVANDNDFITTNGFHAGAAYNGGFNNDTMFLAWRVTIAPVPEPASMLLMALGAAALLARRRLSRAAG